MTETPEEPLDGTGSPASEPFADPDPEAAADEADEDDLDPDDRTADLAEPDDPDGAT